MKTAHLPYVISALMIASCSQDKPAQRTETPTYVGVIDNVYEKHGYALVRLNGSPPPEGTVLISQSTEESAQPRVANLVVSAERLGNLRVPADIRSGTAEKGDLVFLYKNLAPQAKEEQEENNEPITPDMPAPSPIFPPTPLPPAEDDAADTPAPPEPPSDDPLKNIPATLKEAEERDTAGKTIVLPN